MMRIRPQRLIAVFLFSLAAFGGVVRAVHGGTLGFGMPSGPPGLVASLVIDNTPPLSVSETISSFPAVDVFDRPFFVVNPTSTGTMTYDFTGDVTNTSGIPWTDYHFQLGSGLGSSFVLFTGATNQGIDFLASPVPTSDVFTTLGQVTDALSWSGALLQDGDVVHFTFSFTVPDDEINFVLRQFPTVAQVSVPEPSALLFLGSGLAGLAGLARRRAKSK